MLIRKFYNVDTGGNGTGAGNTLTTSETVLNNSQPTTTTNTSVTENKTTEEIIAEKIAEIEKKNKIELDRLRNEAGQANKKLKEIENKGKTAEQLLADEQSKLQEERANLKLESLNNYKENLLVKNKLDYDYYSQFIDINPAMEKAELETKVNAIVKLKEKIRAEHLEELKKNNNSVINSGVQSSKGSLGKTLAQMNIKPKETTKETWFKNS